jgi:transposase
VDVVVPVKPERCHHCQHLLPGENPQPQRHQVTKIPPVKPVVTAYQLHRLVCPACGEETRAEVPAGVPTGGFGPRVQASTALCTGAYHLSKRTTQRALEDMLYEFSCGEHTSRLGHGPFPMDALGLNRLQPGTLTW